LGVVSKFDDNSGSNLYGYIDNDGVEIITPEYLYAYPFTGDLAKVLFLDGYFGYINKKGDVISKSTYSRPMIII